MGPAGPIAESEVSRLWTLQRQETLDSVDEAIRIPAQGMCGAYGGKILSANAATWYRFSRIKKHEMCAREGVQNNEDQWEKSREK